MSLPPLAFSQSPASAASGAPGTSRRTSPQSSRRGADDRSAHAEGRDPPKKRNRLTLSCTHCRERKIKCSRSVPCDQCIKRGEASSCHIEPFKHKAAEARAAALAAARASAGAEQPPRPSSPHSSSASSSADAPASLPHRPLPSSSRKSSGSQSQSGSGSTSVPVPLRSVQFPPVNRQHSAASAASPSDPLFLFKAPVPAATTHATPSPARATSTPASAPARAPAPMPPPAPVSQPPTAPASSRNAADELSVVKARLAHLEQVLAQITPGQTPAAANATASAPPPATPPLRGRSPDFFQRSERLNALPDHARIGAVYNVSDLASTQASELSAASDEAGRTRGNQPMAAALSYHLMARTSDSERAQASPAVPRAVQSPEPTRTPRSDSNPNENSGDVPMVTMPNGAIHLDIGTEAEDAAAVLEGLAMSGSKQTRPDSRSMGRMSVQRLMNDGLASPARGSPASPAGCEEMGDAAEEPKPAVAKTDILDPRRIDSFGTCLQSEQCNSKPNAADDEEEDTDMAEAENKEAAQTPEVPCGSYTTPCKLACSNTGFFRLKQGPDTLLGWGLGWAFGAAESAGEFHKISNAFGCPGAPEREAVLRGILRTLPPKDVTLQLVDVYRTRVYYLTGHVVHVPSLIGEIERFYDFPSVEEQAKVLNHVDPGWLGLLLTVLVLGLQFYPVRPPPEYVDIDYLFDGRTIHLWYSAFRSVLVLAGYMSSRSLSVLQAILLAELYSAESDHTQSTLLHIAISNAQAMGLHRLSDARRLPQEGEPRGTTILREVYRRIWWTLVWRDWCASESTGTYTIHMGEFNTPYPGNYNDLDLVQDVIPPMHPSDEHTEMSFVLSKLMIAVAVRENTDLLNQHDMELSRDGSGRRLACQDTRYLDASYRSILDSAPKFFRIGAEEGAGTDMEVQRWLLHQAVFSKLLRLHRVTLFTRVTSRNSCVLLARSILDMQKKLREAQTIVDRLWFILIQSFNAAVVLMLDLLSSEHSPTDRLTVRSEVAEAVDSLSAVRKTAPYVTRSIRILQAMLEEEEAQWNQRNRTGSEPTKGRTDVLSLAMKIKHAIEHNEPLPSPSQAGSSETTPGLVHGTAPPAGMPPAGEFPYLLGTPQVDPPPVAPNGTLSTGLGEGTFDLTSFLASYSNGSDTTATPWEDAKSPKDKEGMSLGPMPVPAPAPSAPANDALLPPATQQDNVGQEGTGLDSFWAWVLSQDGLSGPAPAPAAPEEGAEQAEQASYWARYTGGAPVMTGALLPSPAAGPEAEEAGGEDKVRRLSVASFGSMGSVFGPAPAGSEVATPLPARSARGATPMTPSRAAVAAQGPSDPFEPPSRRASVTSQGGVGSPGFDSWFATSLESFLQN